MRPQFVITVAVTAAAGLLAGCSPDEKVASPTTTTTSSSTPTSASTPTSPPSKPAPPPSIAGLPAAAIVARAQAALHEARSFRITGTDNSGGQSTSIDMRFGRTGSHGSITIDGGAIRLIVIGKTSYLQLSDKAWRSDLPKREAEATIELMRGRWLKAPTKHPDWKGLTDFGDRPGMVASMFEGAGPTFRKTAPKTVNGVQCIGLDDRAGVLWVDITNARPVRLEPPKGAGTTNFSEFGTAAEPKAPPAASTVDVTKLGR